MKLTLLPIALCSFAIAAFDYKPIDPTLVKNGELQLPEIGGSAKLPGPAYKWYSLPDVKGLKEYAVIDLGSGNQVILKILLNTPIYADAQFTNIFNHIQRDVKADVQNLGAQVTRDTTVVLDVPPHEKIKTHVLTGKGPDSELTILSFVISTGQCVIIVQDYSPDAKPTQQLMAFLGSLRYTKQAPKTGGIPPQMAPARPALSNMDRLYGFLTYLIGGGIVAALVQGIGAAMGKRINGANAAVFAILVAMIVFIVLNMSGAKQNASAYLAGQEIGFAFFPMLIFALVARYQNKRWESEDQSSRKNQRGPSNFRF